MATVKNTKLSLPVSRAVLRRFQASAQKINMILCQLRGLKVEAALAYLRFSKKRAATSLRDLLLSAIANAVNGKGANADMLVISEATVGRAGSMKRLDIKGRSRSGRIEKPLSHVRIVLSEGDYGSKS